MPTRSLHTFKEQLGSWTRSSFPSRLLGYIGLRRDQALDFRHLPVQEEDVRHLCHYSPATHRLHFQIAGAQAQNPVAKEVILPFGEHHVIRVVTVLHSAQYILVGELPWSDSPEA